MKIEKMLTWAIPIGVAGAILWWWTSQQPAVVVTPTQPAVAPNGQLFIGSATGDPAASTVGVVGTMLAMAEQQLGIPRSELVVRGLRPEDLGLTTSWNFTSTAANTWETWVNSTIADNRFVSISGVSFGGSVFKQARIQAGARTSGVWNLTFIAGLISQLWYVPSPIIIQQNEPVSIDIIGTGVATESVSLMGSVVERRGLLINP